MRTAVMVQTIVSLLIVSVANAQYYQKRGTVIGGLTGAAAGAIIGDNSDESGVGAAIGGVVGAVAGSVLGSAEDQRAEGYRAMRYHQAAQQQRQQQTYAVGLGDVITMTQSGISDGVIIAAIQNRGIQQPLAVSDIVFLNRNGVNDAVILAMQNARPATVVTTGPPPRSTVITTYPAPVYYRQPACHHYYGRGPRYGHHGPPIRGPIYIR